MEELEGDKGLSTVFWFLFYSYNPPAFTIDNGSN